jgi:hypothetical protein
MTRQLSCSRSMTSLPKGLARWTSGKQRRFLTLSNATSLGKGLSAVMSRALVLWADMGMSIGKVVRAMIRRWWGPFARARKIVKVTVRDQDFRIIKGITSDRDLAAFHEMWSKMTEADHELLRPRSGRFHYTLDIQSTGHNSRTRSNRWHYHSDGFMSLLAIRRAICLAPLYRMPCPGEFERIFRVDVR